MRTIGIAAAGALVAGAAMLALGGCGEEDEPPSTPPVANEAGKLVIAALGDSITAGSPGYDPDPAARAAYSFGEDERSTYEYWAEREGHELEIRNCGVFGERTEQIAARLESCADGADGVVIQGGINDIAQRYSFERAAENLRGIAERAKELGLRVAIADVLPWNNGYPQADPRIQALNLLIAEVALKQGVSLLPFHDTLEDPDRPGRMKPEWTADGDHPSIEGYRRLGELAFRPPS
jgi:acyl-CoA thioesterase-1